MDKTALKKIFAFVRAIKPFLQAFYDRYTAKENRGKPSTVWRSYITDSVLVFLRGQ